MRRVGHPYKGRGRGIGCRRAIAALALLGVAATTPVLGAEAIDPVSPELATARAASAKAWQAAPLGFAKALFVEGDVGGFGQYTPLATAVFAPDDTLTVYAQPLGYGFVQSDEGYGIRLVADYELSNRSGQVLAAQTRFAELSYDSRDARREFHAILQFRFEGLRPGDYDLNILLRDSASEKQGNISLPFQVRAETADTDAAQ
jgi:hypothetical protein